jgi:phenylacetate-CoA ligase
VKEKIYFILPNVFQNILISLKNFLANKKRYGGSFKKFFILFKKNRNLTLNELIENQSKRYTVFINQVIERSPYYREQILKIEGYSDIENIKKLPIIKKETLRKNIDSIYTISKNKGIVSKTGGTTGKSLEVLYTLENLQERYAMCDGFRSKFGYKLGERTAWFSGKNILDKYDIKRKCFWKTDYLYNVRYYSTFHIKDTYLEYYIKNIQKYKPRFIVGFPSSILEIAKYGLKNNFKIKKGSIRAIFPTAESITAENKFLIEEFFKSKVYDQYASSEGAPFIFECEKNKLHLELQSGVFEVLDSKNKDSFSGRLIVTSFTTLGTPLIRYDIGDSIKLSNAVCSCGNNNPLVEEILGREDDYIYSLENGKINLGNISNTLKDTKGIKKFQVIQNELNVINIKTIVDKLIYNKKIESVFIKNWRDRVGEKMTIDINYVTEIATEKSGKFRLVKNNIKHLI